MKYIVKKVNGVKMWVDENGMMQEKLPYYTPGINKETLQLDAYLREESHAFLDENMLLHNESGETLRINGIYEDYYWHGKFIFSIDLTD